MSLHALGGTSAVPSSLALNTPPETASRPSAPEQEAQVDKVTLKPLPLRFPWLSRLSNELERASGQAAPFSAAPVLGDHVDKQA